MNTQQRVMSQLDTQHGRTVGGIAWSAHLTYDETQAALMALRDKQIAVQRGGFWYLAEMEDVA